MTVVLHSFVVLKKKLFCFCFFFLHEKWCMHDAFLLFKKILFHAGFLNILSATPIKCKSASK